MRQLFVVLLYCALVICAALPNPASARNVFQVYGANGDAGSNDECPVGSYFVGVVGRTGSWIDQIAVVCGELKPDGSIGGGKALLPRGGTGGTVKNVICGKDEAVSALSIGRSKSYQISLLRLTCLNIRTLATNIIGFDGNSNYSGNGTSQACKTGELGSGMVVRYGQHVNGLALICGDYRRAADPAADAAANKAREDQLADERRVTGKTAQQCQASSRVCEARIKLSFPGNPQVIRFEVARQCQPILAQCMANVKTAPLAEGPFGPLDKKNATAVNATDMYPDNSGNSDKICSMSGGDKGTFLGEKDGEPRWLNISGMSGDCRGKTGWVWKGDTGRDVSIN